MATYNYFLILATCFLSISFGHSQENKELDQLDKAAFEALESNSTDVIQKAENLLHKSQERKSGKYESNAYTILGIVNKNKGYYITSVDHYFKALDAAERINDKARVSSCYSNIGSVYQLQENYVRALEYFKKSLAIEETLKNPLQKSIRYYNIGESYRDLDSMDLALTYFNRSLIIERKHKNDEGIVFALLGKADIYISLNLPSDATINLSNVLTKLKPQNVEVSILYHILKGQLLFSQKKFDEALSELNEANSISTKNQYRVYLPEIYEEQIKIYNKLKKWKESVEVYKKHAALNSELNSIKVKNQLEDLTFQNTLNKKELEIRLVKEERDLAKKNDATKKEIVEYEEKIVWFLVFSIALILGLIIYGIRRITKE